MQFRLVLMLVKLLKVPERLPLVSRLVLIYKALKQLRLVLKQDKQYKVQVQ